MSKLDSSSFLSSLLSYAVAGAFALCVAPAAAQVTQTDAAKTPLPQPVGSAELSLVGGAWAWDVDTLSYTSPSGMNLMGKTIRYGDYYSPNGGYPAGSQVFPQFVSTWMPDPTNPNNKIYTNDDAITLQGLFKWRGEAIDPVKDAKTGPGYFSPACGFDGKLLLLGGNCDVKFGWYNVSDPNSTTPPTPDQIYPFIPEPTFVPDPAQPAGTTLAQDLKCNDGNVGSLKKDGFCPLAWDNRHPYDLSIQRWDNTKVFPSGNIKTDPHYTGGYVAFAVITDPNNAKCNQNKFSLYGQNPKNSQGVPWVTTLIYQSTIDPSSFYMAFEDRPMSTADWRVSGIPNDQLGGCDGDFNDFVFYVSGITCAGGNQPCTTQYQGACAVGHTDCAADGETPTCRPVVQPSPEVCDNIDNDCDGVIDNGMGLCPDPSKSICYQGTCVGNCGKGEFQCDGNKVCDATSGYCVDPTCSGVSCPLGQSCQGGTCVDPCASAKCPYGQVCELGQCVDPCKGVTCPTDRVCEKGLCLAACPCRTCDSGLVCQNGTCVDTACASVTCDPGKMCVLGVCKDPCDGVSCPHTGDVCSMGTCVAGNVASGGGPGTGGGIGSLAGGATSTGGSLGNLSSGGAAG
ncbi:MAG TPA: DUF4114 domain-containing protein, partial [Polyangiaceae bacterium]